MNELTSIVKEKIHQQLKSKINASIYVQIYDEGTLYVKIKKFNSIWSYTSNDVMNIIHTGSILCLVDHIVKSYRRDVLAEYFY